MPSMRYSGALSGRVTAVSRSMHSKRLALQSTAKLFPAALACLMLGCSGAAPSPSKQTQTSSAPPRITPPPLRSAPVNEPEPEKPADPAPPKHPVGPWLEYQVASSDLIEGKSYLRLLKTTGFDSVLELSS